MTVKRKLPLGEINGFHAALFKVNMVLIPVLTAALLAWGAWVTTSIVELKSFAEYGLRFSSRDALEMKDAIVEYVDTHFVRK
jgi:hypothetical protein